MTTNRHSEVAMTLFRTKPESIHATLGRHILADGFHIAIDLEGYPSFDHGPDG